MFLNSNSATSYPFSKRFVSERILPFSAIRLCPAKTRSVDDSPSPASA